MKERQEGEHLPRREQKNAEGFKHWGGDHGAKILLIERRGRCLRKEGFFKKLAGIVFRRGHEKKRREGYHCGLRVELERGASIMKKGIQMPKKNFGIPIVTTLGVKENRSIGTERGKEKKVKQLD